MNAVGGCGAGLAAVTPCDPESECCLVKPNHTPVATESHGKHGIQAFFRVIPWLVIGLGP